mmetsp:Transcript_24681/g.38399  ORF Transcript_24681/g.38399 Transcript_24681/m.38399 type:complete len:85 (+) Transcript_24681:1955-2209(+)
MTVPVAGAVFKQDKANPSKCKVSLLIEADLHCSSIPNYLLKQVVNMQAYTLIFLRDLLADYSTKKAKELKQKPLEQQGDLHKYE